MGLHQNVLIVASTLVVVSFGIPTSLVEEIKSSELRNNKVKRARPTELNVEGNEVNIPYYKSSAIKRGVNVQDKFLPNSHWEPDQTDFINRNALPNVSSSLFRYPDSSTFGDDKKLSEYEKGYRYATSKDSLDEALENAVLKSEIYGDPSALNQYRYYGSESAAATAKKRKRRDAKNSRFQSRLKREVELSPEDVLTLLSLYENNHLHQSGVPQIENYRYPWTRLESNVVSDELQDQDDESWLNTPLYPHASYDNDLSSQYLYENGPQEFEGKDRWRGLGADGRNKRFMVSKRRNIDPTRELRYINGPNKNDFYTLSQLLTNPRYAEAPAYRRLVL